MSSTELSRSAFHAINDHQQIQKYDAVNNYQVFMRSLEQVGYVAGNANTGKHYDFKVFFPPNQSDHIKKARIKLKAIIFPNAGTGLYGVNWVSLGGINCNTYECGSHATTGKKSNLVSPFIVKQLNNFIEHLEGVPALETKGAILDQAGHVDGTLANPNHATNTGAVMDSAAPGVQHQIELAKAAAISNVTRAAYNQHSTKPVNVSGFGKGLDNWVTCDNPFGKEVHVQIFAQDGATLNNLIGHAADLGTTIVWEVQLVPDSQANDRFSY